MGRLAGTGYCEESLLRLKRRTKGERLTSCMALSTPPLSRWAWRRAGPVGSGVDAVAAIPGALSPLLCALAFDVRLMPSKKKKRKMEPECQWAPSVVSVTSSSAAVEHRALGAVFFSPLFLPSFLDSNAFSLSLSFPPLSP